jgi:cbb3-type cytochrome oxidase subunit 3
MGKTATALLTLVLLFMTFAACTGWITAAHWKAQADKYAYALSDE